MRISSCFDLFIDLRRGSVRVRKGEWLPTWVLVVGGGGGLERRPELLDLQGMLGIPIAGFGSRLGWGTRKEWTRMSRKYEEVYS